MAAVSELGWVYLNGAFLHADEARISPFDRGYLFAQSAYEVTAVYKGELIDFDDHLVRLERTLKGIEILPPAEDLKRVHKELISRNQLEEGLVYLQVSGGLHGQRDFYGPEELSPTVFMYAVRKRLITDYARNGISAITVEDTRWRRRDMKTTQLLSQSLAYRAARRLGAETAIMHEAGFVTEAASANLWIVTDQRDIVTRDLSQALLPGITRQSLLKVLRSDGLKIQERAPSLKELRTAHEVFTSSTGVMIAPVTRIDGLAVGDGVPGPITRQVQAAYYAYIGADLSSIEWL